MTTHQLQTPGAIELHVEIGRGRVRLQVDETTETLVEIDGDQADRVSVHQDGRSVVVKAPQRSGLFGGEPSLDVRVVLPHGSDVSTRTGSADLLVDGELASLDARSGSGDVTAGVVTGEAQVVTGSGDVRLGHVGGELRLKSGSGDLRLDTASGLLQATTGSGDVEVGALRRGATVKTGSGDLRIADAAGAVTLRTGSGDLDVRHTGSGRFDVKGASSDVRIGVSTGVAVWTDIHTVSGSIRSQLDSVGEPAPGADHVEVRATTISGDVLLLPA